MYRSFFVSASALALITSVAFAQDNQAAPEAPPEAPIVNDTVMEIIADEANAHVLTPPAAIIDVAQVTTRDDARLFAEAEFTQADLDLNGKISKEEFLAYAAAKAAPAINEVDEATGAIEPHAASVKIESEGDADSMETAVETATTPEEQFAELANGDKKITKDELVESRIANFDEADVNNDETLDDEERQQFAALITIAKPADSL